MTISEYQFKHGTELRQHSGDNWFAALLNVLEWEHPARKIVLEPDGNKASAPLLFLARIEGYQLASNVITDCANEPETPLPEPNSTFAEPELP